jgi:internalin A
VANLKQLKSLNLEGNKLTPGSLAALSLLSNLQTLSVGMNLLGKPVATNMTTTNIAAATKMLAGQQPRYHPKTTNPNQPLPSPLPAKLKSIKLNANFLSSLPIPILSLAKLEKLDLSQNHLASVPVEIGQLTNLNELNLDDNSMVSLPEAIGLLTKLKVLSLRRNHISASNMNWSDTTNPQPLPATLFTDTPLIDLNLHDNPLTSTQLNSMDGYAKFLERRKEVKTNALLGGALTNLDVCGLE